MPACSAQTSHSHKKLLTFFGPWGRDRSQSPPCWIFGVTQIHPSTASERTTRQDVIMVMIVDRTPLEMRTTGYLIVTPPYSTSDYPSKHGAFTQCCFNVGPASKTVGQHWNSIGWIQGWWIMRTRKQPFLTVKLIPTWTCVSPQRPITSTNHWHFTIRSNTHIYSSFVFQISCLFGKK